MLLFFSHRPAAVGAFGVLVDRTRWDRWFSASGWSLSFLRDVHDAFDPAQHASRTSLFLRGEGGALRAARPGFGPGRLFLVLLPLVV